MLRRLALLAALLASPALAADPVALTPSQMLDWSGDGGLEQVFTSGDLTLTLRLADEDVDRRATLKVEKPGTAPIEISALTAGAGYGQVGVFPFDEAGGRSVFFAVYSGGAHCCMQVSAVTELGNGFVTDDIGSADGDGIVPKDLDGDGLYELPLWDGRFGYAFDAFAFSLMPAQIYKSKDGASYDASADPRFRPYYETQLALARETCGGDTWDLGGCAGLLGIAARLGSFDTELETVKAALAAGKKTSGWDEFDLCLNDDCTETRKVADFADAITESLTAWGYLPPR